MSASVSGGALTSAAAVRNRAPILSVLRRVLPSSGTVLEVASGSGEHVVYFGAALSGLTWQPTDRDQHALRSIAAHQAEAGLSNVLPPLALDVSQPPLRSLMADAILAINMVHISPWSATQGLMRLSERVLPAGGVLYLYGPYLEAAVPLAPSNAAFDASLRERHPAWGLRDLGQVEELAARHGMGLEERVEMPSNNLSLVFRRRGVGSTG